MEDIQHHFEWINLLQVDADVGPTILQYQTPSNTDCTKHLAGLVSINRKFKQIRRSKGTVSIP